MLSPHENIEGPSSQVLCESDSVNLENESILTSQLVNSTSQFRNITSNDQVASDEAANTDKDLEVEHNKELELSQLKEHIEKNKQALSELQAKAETEISKA
ncbi:hypothetical protein L1987_45476 [Smallanthus sonchifolius]|uniref:Uncharacterized protein n=1 Tax=Smallanthus sonchifolius TaxID=185202 RepID=A0ACB9FX64_9ASTR|nr:hypothetical protein L1987_45476 [Smallanthus sonchifolius]